MSDDTKARAVVAALREAVEGSASSFVLVGVGTAQRALWLIEELDCEVDRLASQLTKVRVELRHAKAKRRAKR